MKTISIYRCEICNTEYDRPDEALECEGFGLPKPMPFLPWNRPIPAFGETRIEYARIVAVRVVRRSIGHEWQVFTDPCITISHNLETSRWIPARAFDPRHGYDAFRYYGDLGDLKVWKKAMKTYRLKEEDCSFWIKEQIGELREKRAL